MTFEEATPIGKAAKANSTVDAYWVRAWGQLNEEGKIVKITCEWNGTSANAVLDVLKKANLPYEGVYPMTAVDAEDFR